MLKVILRASDESSHLESGALNRKKLQINKLIRLKQMQGLIILKVGDKLTIMTPAISDWEWLQYKVLITAHRKLRKLMVQ